LEELSLAVRKSTPETLILVPFVVPEIDMDPGMENPAMLTLAGS
jgi:hypothetical protein